MAILDDSELGIEPKTSFWNNLKLEHYMLFALWIGVLLNIYEFAFNEWPVDITDGIGLLCVILSSVLVWLYPKGSALIVAAALFVATFRLGSFYPYIRTSHSFHFGFIHTPFFYYEYLFSLLVLAYVRRFEIRLTMPALFRANETERMRQAQATKNHFKNRFNVLSTEEIHYKLTQNLNVDARAALEEILADRNAPGKYNDADAGQRLESH